MWSPRVTYRPTDGQTDSGERKQKIRECEGAAYIPTTALNPLDNPISGYCVGKLGLEITFPALTRIGQHLPIR